MMWAMILSTGLDRLAQGLSSWWSYFAYYFQDLWQFGDGRILFEYEPMLIILSAIVAQVCFRLKPKTIWSGPGLVLGTYMFFWFHPVIYYAITGYRWEPIDGYFPTMYITIGVGQLLCVRHGFIVDWRSACWFALVMLASQYLIPILWLALSLPEW
jgi:hypothetical protein